MKYLENQPEELMNRLQENALRSLPTAATAEEGWSLEREITAQMDFEKLTELCEHLKDAVQEILHSGGLYFRIFSRVKSADSIARKIRKGHYGSEENPKKIQDLVGLRIVLYYYDDLSICREILEKTFQLIDGWSRSKYSANEFKATKTNGVFRFPEEYFKLYKREAWTLPIDTTFEVQFRTVFFEGWHEIEHDMRYKSLLSDDEFWKGSEELSRVLNCILANLELSDWSLVQLFDQLSYNHYKNANWELMLKSKYRIRMDESSSLDPRILEIFDRSREVAKQFFKAERISLIKELLKLDNPHIDYNLIVNLMNRAEVHNDEIAAICDNLAMEQEERPYQKIRLARLESSVLFHLEQPLLHREARKLEAEFTNAAGILYKWARFKFNSVFEDIPAEVSSYKNNLPGYQLKIIYQPEDMFFSMKLHHIDSKSMGTIWHFDSAIEPGEEGKLQFHHMTSRDMPRGLSAHSTFNRPSFLADLSSKVGITDIVRLGSKAHFTTTDQELAELMELIENPLRRLPVILIAQCEPDPKASPSSSQWNHDMNTFTINGTRLAKVVGNYSHVYMIDHSIMDAYSQFLSCSLQDTSGSICIFWQASTRKKREFYTRKMVIDTQFDFNRFAFHDVNIHEKAFRHKLVQIIKDEHVSTFLS